MKVYPNRTHPKLFSYLSGFILSLLLTLAAFGLVDISRESAFPHSLIVAGISSLAMLQILVHLHYFLHLGLGSRHTLVFQAILFACFILFIMVSGSLWILHDLSVRMLPTSR